MTARSSKDRNLRGGEVAGTPVIAAHKASYAADFTRASEKRRLFPLGAPQTPRGPRSSQARTSAAEGGRLRDASGAARRRPDRCKIQDQELKTEPLPCLINSAGSSTYPTWKSVRTIRATPRYPQLFARRNWPMNRSCMYWGFPGNGWFDLIDTLAERLQFWTDRRGAVQLIVEQAKEKLGLLEVYVNAAGSEHITGEQKGMVRMASAMSERICEVCGHPGWLIDDDETWYRVRCAPHRDRRTDDPVPVLYTFASQDPGHVVGHIAVGGTPVITLAEPDAAVLLAAARKEGYDELQIVRVRDLSELPTRLPA